ncbi:MAG TPA: RNB domain-containing ribonuclease [Acidimicrobiia bacterium]
MADAKPLLLMPARVVRVPIDDPELRAGLARIRESFDVPASFPSDVLAAAPDARGRSRERHDLRDLDLVTIDPPGSRDLDQAYAAERHGNGFRVHYAIADVEAFVRDGDVVDQEAHRRGVTVYMPDARAGLYPPAIGEGSASLLPGVERPALCWTFDLDADGTPTGWHLEPATVRSRRAWTYAEAQDAIDAGRGPESLALLRVIGRLRKEAEHARGGFSLSLPSQEVRHRRSGYVLVFDAPRPVETWNAQISLLTGLCAASTMVEAGAGIVRTLPPPDERALRRLHATADALDVAWPSEERYADLLARLDPRDPDHAAFLHQAAETLRGSSYAVLGSGTPPPEHAAIAAPYAHVTAPLRRLADRYANAVLLELFAGRTPPAELRAALDPLPPIMVDGARRAHQVERAVVDLAEALVLRGREGETFPAVVVDVDGARATVVLRRPPIVAGIDADGALLGDEIAVRLVAVDPTARRVELTRVS